VPTTKGSRSLDERLGAIADIRRDRHSELGGEGTALRLVRLMLLDDREHARLTGFEDVGVAVPDVGMGLVLVALAGYG
jgi:hypothetical protein